MMGSSDIIAERQHRASVLAQAPMGELAQCWSRSDLDVPFEIIRGPEVGLIAVKGQVGGGGAPFNFGEATATRVSVKLEDGAVGHAMVLGRQERRAVIAAVVDALAQDAKRKKQIDHDLIIPLQALIADSDSEVSSRAQATRVDFFTMVRGDD